MIIYYVLCFPFFQKKDFNFSDALPFGEGIQKNPLPQKRTVFMVRNFSVVNLIDSHPKNTLYNLYLKCTILNPNHIRNFSTPNRGLGLKTTLKTKTTVLVSNNFSDALSKGGSKKHPI